MKRKIWFLIFLFFVCIVLPVFCQEKEILLHEGWKAKRASEIPVDGTVISLPEFDLVGWMDAVVPGTVLTTLLYNHVFSDPFFGLNNELIPDIYDVGAGFYTFWFRKTFSLPHVEEGQEVWLKFRGINYAADIFLNGRRINPDTHRGMFLRQKYRITPYIDNGGINVLAVIVRPPYPVGEANGGQGGDGTIARSVTQQYTPGWDWVCPVRDRNTGIWDRVSLEITGSVDLRNSFVKTEVPGMRFPGAKQEPAYLTVSTELVNVSNGIQKGNLIAEIDGKAWKLPVSIEAGKSVTCSFPKIKIDNPKLWWPNGMGEPFLYGLRLRFEQHGKITDSDSVAFGIRETGSYFDEEIGGRVFLINGQKIFIKGGNWISSDLLLRLSPKRYEAEVKMHAQMNMNMIRVWGGSITERPEFYDACDKYGILVWQDLWITGDCNGRWFDPRKKESQARRRAYPDDHTLFLNSVVDQIKMLRNHPSLYLWCGGNEFPPPDDIHDRLVSDIFPIYDDTRYYLNESTSRDLSRHDIGGGGDGPYGIQDPIRFFDTPSYPFNPEIGSVGMPNVETMRKMMSEKDLTPPENDRPNPVWQYHKYIGYGETIARFGQIRGIDDFCRKAQVVNYEQYRALQEGFNAGMWNRYTGMLVWKNQNPWTALRGQFYDVFLDPNGGFYGYMHAARPLHVQLNLNDSALCVVNQTLNDVVNQTVEAYLFDIKGKLLSNQRFRMDIPANSVRIAGKADFAKKPTGLYFLRLVLKNEKGEIVDENLYWLTNKPTDLQELQTLADTSLQLKIKKNDGKESVATIKNIGSETAFFIRLKVWNATTNQIVTPVFFSDNYFTLFPGEQKNIDVDFSLLPVELINDTNLILQAELGNGRTVEMPIQ